MRDKFSPKLAALSAAAASVVDKAEAEARERDMLKEVAERLPIKQAMRELATQLQAEVDAALKEALERYLGAEITDPEILRGRLQHFDVQGDEEAGRTYCIDGVAVLWEGPAAIVRDGDTLRANRQLKQLNPEPMTHENH